MRGSRKRGRNKMETQAVKKGLCAVIAAFLLSSLSVILVPFSINGTSELNQVGYVSGILFWAGLLAGSGGYFFLYYKIKNKIQQNGDYPKRPAIICFFSNRAGTINDAVLIISIVVSIYCAVKITVNQTVALIFLFLLLLSIYGHFIFNGKIYRYICKKKN